ncbi:hypothetical protein DL89DRAFT_44535 [Linderina pennispora]|uniref:Uncharacterized protein n=1 Tax=Linderina pennispora TaxID=61395 RepID=A0A1Y1W1U3_9FUNG|nr:uncharacterized protein DL89DRAFT_44535 [Linderina pennispora]ORX67422.1 hypothetical protein DL89DRAFT_44535 [Linderina pennispora]
MTRRYSSLFSCCIVTNIQKRRGWQVSHHCKIVHSYDRKLSLKVGMCPACPPPLTRKGLGWALHVEENWSIYPCKSLIVGDVPISGHMSRSCIQKRVRNGLHHLCIHASGVKKSADISPRPKAHHAHVPSIPPTCCSGPCSASLYRLFLCTYAAMSIRAPGVDKIFHRRLHKSHGTCTSGRIFDSCNEAPPWAGKRRLAIVCRCVFFLNQNKHDNAGWQKVRLVIGAI